MVKRILKVNKEKKGIAGADLRLMVKNHLCTNGSVRQDSTSCTENRLKGGTGATANYATRVQIQAVNHLEFYLMCGTQWRTNNSDQNVRKKRPNMRDNIKLQKA